MKMFGNLTSEGLEDTGDRLGGGGGVFETAVYPGKVKLAYVGKSQSTEAQSVTVIIDIDGREFRETHWVTNKNGENFYPDKLDPKKKQPMSGFTNVDDLCLVTTGYPLADQDTEQKVVNIYDFQARKDIPTNVPVFVDLIGKEVLVAIARQTVDKQKKNDAGVYVNTGETRDENVTEKFFHAESRRTVTEIKQGIEEAIFIDTWAKKHTGVTRNKVKGAEGKTGAPGRPASAGAPTGTAPKKSLFG